jgi:hypothetical protein
VTPSARGGEERGVEWKAQPHETFDQTIEWFIRMIKSRRMRWAGHVTRMEKRNAYRILVGKPEGKRSVGG